MITDKTYLLLNELRKDAEQAVRFIGFLQSFVDNPVIPEKADMSRSNIAIKISKAGVKISLILYCARAWDTAKDAISLPNARKEICGNVGSLSPQDIALDKFCEMYIETERLPQLTSIRILRDEFFAHRVLDSRKRKNLVKSGIEFSDASYRELLDFSEKTVLLVEELSVALGQGDKPYLEYIRRTTEKCNEFWQILPILRDAEQT